MMHSADPRVNFAVVLKVVGCWGGGRGGWAHALTRACTRASVCVCVCVCEGVGVQQTHRWDHCCFFWGWGAGETIKAVEMGAGACTQFVNCSAI